MTQQADLSGAKSGERPDARMDPELKAKWIAALRSGEYEQTTGQLHSGIGYCCLGVLHHVITGSVPDAGWGGRLCSMPEEIEPLRNAGHIRTLTNLNDEALLTFPQLADWIEVNL